MIEHIHKMRWLKTNVSEVVLCSRFPHCPWTTRRGFETIHLSCNWKKTMVKSIKNLQVLHDSYDSWSFRSRNVWEIDPCHFRLQRCPCFQTTRPQRGQHKVCCDCWGAMIRNGSGVGGFKWLQRCVVHVDLPIVPRGLFGTTAVLVSNSEIRETERAKQHGKHSSNM